MGSGPLTEAIQATKKLSWEDVIYTNQAFETPFLALLPRDKKPVQKEMNWPVMNRGASGYAGTMDGADVDSFRHQNRDSLKSLCQWFREPWMVTHFADLTKSWGVKDEAKFQAKEALTRLKMQIEQALLSNMDCVAESGVDQPNETRGAFMWLENDATAISTEYPIGANYRVSAACEYTGAVASFTDDELEDRLIAASNQMKKARTWDAQVGLDLKAQMDSYTQHDPDATTTNASLKSFVQNASDKSFLKQVDFFQFSPGIVRTHINYNLYCAKADGAASAYSPKSGLFLDMDQWKIAFMAGVASHRFENRGGGPRGFHDATLGLKCLMPRGQAVVVSNS